MPTEAVTTFTTIAAKPTAYDVDGRNRPLTGGYYLGPSSCTITGTALRGTDHILMTASHCTATNWGLDYGAIWQGIPTPTFGVEQIDPPYYSCATITAPTKKCRKADIAAYNVNSIPTEPGDTLSWAPGLIAMTTYPTNGVYQSPGSKIISSTPYWTVTATSNSVLVGNTLHKVGNATGWTFGDVTATCVDNKPGGWTVTIVCADKTGMYAGDGDSGSPAFIAGWNQTATFVGVVWAKDPGTSIVWISNFGQMKQDLGTVTFW